jgi:hypothetical protein
MATVKDYATLVKKVNEASEDARGDLAKQKRAVAAELQAKAKSKADRRELKFTMDEINNS